jgi:hypothetical protein
MQQRIGGGAGIEGVEAAVGVKEQCVAIQPAAQFYQVGAKGGKDGRGAAPIDRSKVERAVPIIGANIV